MNRAPPPRKLFEKSSLRSPSKPERVFEQVTKTDEKGKDEGQITEHDGHDMIREPTGLKGGKQWFDLAVEDGSLMRQDHEYKIKDDVAQSRQRIRKIASKISAIRIIPPMAKVKNSHI